MGTLLTLRFSKDLPSELAGRLGAHCQVSGAELSVANIETAPIREVLRHILPFKNSLIFGPYFVRTSGAKDFKSPDVVGGVLGPGEVQGCTNAASDFDPVWPAPCLGLVREGLPLRCHFPPKGLVEMIGEHLIFSTQMIRLLGADKVGKVTRSVHLKNAVLENWVGFTFHHSCRVIDPICFAPPTCCALCHTPYRPWRGLWLGKVESSIGMDVCVDASGYEHHATQHPVIVSPESANTIFKIFRGNRGFSLEPIFDISSDYGRLISLICDHLARDLAEQEQTNVPSE
jgi:hypothetical protein